MVGIWATNINRILYEEYHRWFLWVPVGIGIGIGTYFSLRYEPALFLIPCAFITALLLGLFNYWRPSFPLMLLASVVLGFGAAQMRTMRLSTRMLAERLTVTFNATVLSVETLPEKKRVTLEPENAGLPQRVRLGVGMAFNFNPGDRLRIKAALLPLADPVSPYGYNFRRAAFFQGIGAVGTIKSIKLLTKAPPSLGLMIECWRHTLTNKLRWFLPTETGAIAAALITGDRSGITAQTRQAYADAGIAHILAISGLHLSLVAGLVFLIIKRVLSLIPQLAENYPLKKWAAFLVIIFTAIYLILSGCAIPVKRAFVMTSLVMIGILVDRKALSLRSLALAAIGILLLWPEALLGASFQLSFSAVVALVAVYEWQNYNWLIKKRACWLKILTYVSGILLSTLAATAATTPFTIALFNRFTLEAILCNLLAIPLTGLWVMPMAFVATITLIFGGSVWAFALLQAGIALLTKLAYTFAALPGAAILVATPPPSFVPLVALGGLWLCLWQTRWRVAGMLPLLGGLLLLFFPRPPEVLIAGNGSLIAVRERDTLWLSSDTKATFYRTLWLKELGLSKIASWPKTHFYKNKLLLLDQSQVLLSPRKIRRLCNRPQTIISNRPTKRFCYPNQPAKVLLDSKDLYTAGTYFIWQQKDNLYLLSLKDALGKRPWCKTNVLYSPNNRSPH